MIVETIQLILLSDFHLNENTVSGHLTHVIDEVKSLGQGQNKFTNRLIFLSENISKTSNAKSRLPC